MGHEPQKFIAPDGTEMVVLPAADYAKLKLLAEDGEDRLAAQGQHERLAGFLCVRRRYTAPEPAVTGTETPCRHPPHRRNPAPPAPPPPRPMPTIRNPP